MIACIRCAKVPKVSFNGHADNKRVCRWSMAGPKEAAKFLEEGVPLRK